MDADQLLTHIEPLPADTPLLRVLEQELQVGVGYGRAWYKSQKQHWVRWLSDYSSPGPYGRRPKPRTPAQRVYNRLMCPPMVFWLAEASGVPDRRLLAAFECAVQAEANCARQTAAIRKVIPWGRVHAELEQSSPENTCRCRGDAIRVIKAEQE